MSMMDPGTLGQLLDEHAAALTLYARQWSAAPEDVVQEAFLKLIAQRKSPANPVSWLFRVVRNQAISAWRHDERRRRHERQSAQSEAWFQPSDKSFLDADAAAIAVQSLPDAERETIVLHLWGGLTFAEIAQVMESTASTVHRWYLAGLTQLRERLDVPCSRKT